MPKSTDINPRMLSWARETAGLSLDGAAAKLGIRSSVELTASEKLKQAESGQRPVSKGLLERAAAAYRRPLVTFYLAGPPARGQRGEDFRAPVTTRSLRDDAVIDALIRDLRGRQQLVRDVLADDEDAPPHSFVASSRMADGAIAVAARIRNTLGVTVQQQRSARDARRLFAGLRAAAEATGIFVLLLGDLGSHHSDIEENTFRGFALADPLAPFVGINDNDAPAAWSFTLLHELAHIWIGATGISGSARSTPDNAIEWFCNEVAGVFLLPPEAMDAVADRVPADFGFEQALALTAELAGTWHVSQGVATFRLLRSGWINDRTATNLFQILEDRRGAERMRRVGRDSEKGGPDYYTLKRSRLGSGLLGTVRRALRENAITHTKAARILGVAPTSVDRLLRERRRAA